MAISNKRLPTLAGLLTVFCGIAFWLILNNGSPQSLFRDGNLSGTLALLKTRSTNRTSDLLLAANCFRQLGQTNLFLEYIEQARHWTNNSSEIDLAVALFRVQKGEFNDVPRDLVDTLRNAGADSVTAKVTVVQGLFSRNDLELGRQLLLELRSEKPSSVWLPYLTAIYQNLSGNKPAAERLLLESLRIQPEHELTWLSLAELFSSPPNVQFHKADIVFSKAIQRFPHNQLLRLRHSRVRRRLGLPQGQAKPTSSDLTADEGFELSQVGFFAGEFKDSAKLLDNTGLRKQLNLLLERAFQLSTQGNMSAAEDLTQRVRWCATCLTLAGDWQAGNSMFAATDGFSARVKRLEDLSIRQHYQPGNTAIHDELNQVAISKSDSHSRGDGAKTSGEDAPEMALFLRYCSMCHGAKGDGVGAASKNLFPPSRNFLAEPMRMVSTINRVASDPDLRRTIREGLPGTAMPAFKSLSDDEVDQIVQTIRYFQIRGLKDQLLFSQNQGLDFDERSWLDQRIYPSSAFVIPEMIATSDFLAAGHQVFEKYGCSGCHSIGGPGRGPSKIMHDQLGRPICPPNLAVDEFHSGSDAANISRRILAGIPGTPHPQAAMSTHELSSLLQYILSQRTVPPPTSTNHSRRRQTDLKIEQ